MVRAGVFETFPPFLSRSVSAVFFTQERFFLVFPPLPPDTPKGLKGEILDFLTHHFVFPSLSYARGVRGFVLLLIPSLRGSPASPPVSTPEFLPGPPGSPMALAVRLRERDLSMRPRLQSFQGASLSRCAAFITPPDSQRRQMDFFGPPPSFFFFFALKKPLSPTHHSPPFGGTRFSPD